ncbi:Protein BM-GLC-4, isoform b [Apostichopus japonicus]|uniref:Protein BM-GLC-4, isoform b n=1 Tax=Stichopus japonicus TaxID=307972 RepID=A0A2G8LGN1_STIJA|nr:Protein BM-GLC-4, isoform b [Apostichopus japonicus]
MLVMLSCVSFMIDLRSVAARVSLGITTILTMLTTTIGVQNDLPRVAHAKAIDVWFLVNFVYVLGALLEYALVHYIGIQLPSEKHLQESEIQGDPNCISPEAEETQSDRSPAASSPVLCINSAWFPSFLRSRLDKKFEDGQSHRDALNHYYRFIELFMGVDSASLSGVGNYQTVCVWYKF